MLDGEIKITEKLEPTGLPLTKLSLRMQIPQGSMISKDGKRSPDQVMTPLLKTQHQTNKLTLSRTIPSLST